jgi:hypothetical protein
MQNWCGICFFTLLLLQVLKVAFMDPEFSDVTFQFSGNYKAWCDQYHMMIWFVSLLCVFEASTCIWFCNCEDGWGRPTWSTRASLLVPWERPDCQVVGPVDRSGGQVRIQKEVLPSSDEGQDRFLELCIIFVGFFILPSVCAVKFKKRLLI